MLECKALAVSVISRTRAAVEALGSRLPSSFNGGPAAAAAAAATSSTGAGAEAPSCRTAAQTAAPRRGGCAHSRVHGAALPAPAEAGAARRVGRKGDLPGRWIRGWAGETAVLEMSRSMAPWGGGGGAEESPRGWREIVPANFRDGEVGACVRKYGLVGWLLAAQRSTARHGEAAASP